MKTFRSIPRIVLDVGTSLDVRDAIALPHLLARLPAAVPVTLDFRHVKSIQEAPLLALLPALASVKDRLVRLIGLSGVVVERDARSGLPA